MRTICTLIGFLLSTIISYSLGCSFESVFFLTIGYSVGYIGRVAQTKWLK